jgi:hypothetical protein
MADASRLLAGLALPRRFACRPLDGYDLPPLNHALHHRLAVTLDGRAVCGVVAADADAGFIVAIARDETGNMISEGGAARLAELRGAVVIGWA